MKLENPKKEYVKLQLIFAAPGGAIHNLKCWLCEERSAVYHMNPTWVFGPCWECEKKLTKEYGVLRRIKNPILNWFLNL